MKQLKKKQRKKKVKIVKRINKKNSLLSLATRQTVQMKKNNRNNPKSLHIISVLNGLIKPIILVKKYNEMLLSCGSHEYHVKAAILNNFKDI